MALRQMRRTCAPPSANEGGEAGDAGAKRDGGDAASRCEAVVYAASAFAALVGDVLPEGTVRELAADSPGDEDETSPLFATMRTCEEAADACVRDELPGSARAARAVRAAKLALDGVVGGSA